MGFLFCGGEDSEYVKIGSVPAVDATAGRFRVGYAQCGLQILQTAASFNTDFWRAENKYSSADFWFSAQVYNFTNGGARAGNDYLRFTDASSVLRLRIRCTAGFDAPNTSTFVVEKLDAAGTATQLGSSFSIPIGGNALGKLDIHIVYAVSGAFAIYANRNPTPVFSYTGDVTTNSVIALAGHDLGVLGVWQNTTGSNVGCIWSETICHTDPTFTMSLAYGRPAAFGNTHAWAGAVADINELTLDLASLNSSDTAGQLQQFTLNAIPAGNFSVRALVVTGVLAKGTSGPTKDAFNVRTAGTDYFGADLSMSALNVPMTFQTAFETNPGTGVAWLTSQVGNTAGFNIGMRSAT